MGDEIQEILKLVKQFSEAEVDYFTYIDIAEFFLEQYGSSHSLDVQSNAVFAAGALITEAFKHAQTRDGAKLLSDALFIINGCGHNFYHYATSTYAYWELANV